MTYEESRHDLCMVSSPTDHGVMMPKYPGKILVGDDRRSTEIIRETCEDVSIGMMDRYVHALYLSPGFSDFDNLFINKYTLNSQNWYIIFSLQTHLHP